MKRIVATIVFASTFLVLSGQGTPDWLDENFRRKKFPENTYYTGFAYGKVAVDKPLQEVTQQMKTEAQAELSQKIRMKITSRMQNERRAVSADGQYRESENFISLSATESSTEVAGVKTESYYNAKTRTVYAFASVSRHELGSYYGNSIAMNLAQAEGLLQTAQDLEAAGERAKARRQGEAVKPLLVKIRAAQDMLVAIDANITPNDLQQARTEALYNRLAQLLAQDIPVYVESNENLFGTKVNIVANQLKAELAKSGCSFVDNAERADLKLRINVSTRHSSSSGGFVFCYADVQVELYDVRKQQVVYSDEIAQKGGGISQDGAARTAMTEAVQVILEKLKTWVEN
jgi:hypothetical protein